MPVLLLVLALFSAPLTAEGQGGGPPLWQLSPSGQKGEWNFDVTGRKLDAIAELHLTGMPQDVDRDAWRLAVGGAAAARSLSLSYDELAALPRVKKAALLICPGVFEDFAEWEGVPLADLLAAAGVSDSWQELTVTSVDRYPATFTRAQLEEHLVFLALAVNGETLPKAHGFPARLVAEGILGGSWVKWVASIEVR